MSPKKPPTLRWNQQDLDAWHEWIEVVHQVRISYYVDRLPGKHGPEWFFVACAWVVSPGDAEHNQLLVQVQVALTNQFAVNIWELGARAHGALLQQLNELLSSRFDLS